MKRAAPKFGRTSFCLGIAFVAGLVVSNTAFGQRGSHGGGKQLAGGGKSLSSGMSFKPASLSGGSLLQASNRGIAKSSIPQLSSQKRLPISSSGFNQGGLQTRGTGKPGGVKPGSFNPKAIVPFQTKSNGLNPTVKSGSVKLATSLAPKPSLGSKPFVPKVTPLSPPSLQPTKGSGLGGVKVVHPKGTIKPGNWKSLQTQWCHYPLLARINHCSYVRCHPNLHWRYTDWCYYYPQPCHWWYGWCGSNYYFDPTCCVTYSWYYYPCSVVTAGVTQRFSWHLGVNCVFIPGRGLGVQEVEAGSPAEAAGLQSGMVILTANGAELVTEGVMQSVMESSTGRISLTVIPAETAEPVTIDVQMGRVVSSNF